MNQEIKNQAHKEFEDFIKEYKHNDCDLECNAHGESLYCHLDDEPNNKQNVIPQIKSFIDSLIDKTVQMTEERIVEENQDSDSFEKQERLIEAIKNKEDVFVSENGYALSSEDYYNFEEWVESVGKPEGSTVEKFTKYTITNKSDINK